MNEELMNRILDIQLHKHFTPRELMYSSKPDFNLTPHEYKEYLDFLGEKLSRDESLKGCVLPLESFDGKPIHNLPCSENSVLVDSFMDIISDSIKKRGTIISSKFDDDVVESRIYSEIEGTLNIENVPTTRKRLTDLIKNNADPKDLNDVIIKNMEEGIRFVYTLPSFNKENLLKLYKILSNGCLKKEDEIKDGAYYRDDDVEVDGYQGCPFNKVTECMDSLFAFVDQRIAKGDGLECFILPHICHYYIVYIHPYFDYNGRTARMVSLWINLLLEQWFIPPVISEAINQTKNDYYQALRDTRNSNNDISYFLSYILKTTIRYALSYKDLDGIDQYVKNQGTVLTKTELNYIKRILVTYKGKFAYKDFVSNCQIEVSKQGALKILNKLVDLGVLNIVDTPSKVKLFDINHEIVNYTKARD